MRAAHATELETAVAQLGAAHAADMAKERTAHASELKAAATSTEELTTRLQSIDLSNNDLNEEAAIVLAPALAASTSLTGIDLAFNAFNDQAATPLAEVLANSASLEECFLSSNPFDDASKQLLQSAAATKGEQFKLEL